MVRVTYEDGEQTPVRSEWEAFNDLLFAVDNVAVTFDKGFDKGWVYFGNSPEEAADDWSVNLNDTMNPLRWL